MTRLVSLRALVPVATALLLTACGSTSHQMTGEGESPIDEFQKACVKPDPLGMMEPLVLHWDGLFQNKMRERLVSGGLVAFRFDGCEIKPLLGCKIPGRYAIQEHPLHVRQEIYESNVEFSVGLPLVFNLFHTHLDVGRKIEVNYLTASVHKASRSQLTQDDLVPGCEGATHFLSGAYLGAYEISSENTRGAGVGAGVAGVGVGTSRSVRRKSVNGGGQFQRCRRIDRPSSDMNCQAHVRLTLKKVLPALRTLSASRPIPGRPAPERRCQRDSGSPMGGLFDLAQSFAGPFAGVLQNMANAGLGEVLGVIGQLELEQGLGPALELANQVIAPALGDAACALLGVEMERLEALGGLEQMLGQVLSPPSGGGPPSLGQIEEAQRRVDAVDRAHPGESSVRSTRSKLEIQHALQAAELARRTGRKSEALHMLAEVNRIHPGDTGVQRALAQEDGFERRHVCNLSAVGEDAFVDLRRGVAADSAIIDRLYEGARLAVMEAGEGWLRVLVLQGAHDKTAGYVPSQWTCVTVGGE